MHQLKFYQCCVLAFLKLKKNFFLMLLATSMKSLFSFFFPFFPFRHCEGQNIRYRTCSNHVSSVIKINNPVKYVHILTYYDVYCKADGFLVPFVENSNICLIDSRFCMSHTFHVYYLFRPFHIYDLIW